MKLHKDFKEKHGLDDEWEIKSQSRAYDQYVELDGPNYKIMSTMLQNGMIIRICKDDQDKAFIVPDGENYMEVKA